MNEYFISYCFYIGLILVLLIGFGFGFHWLVLSGWKNFGQKFGVYAFLPRFIGTPVHEIGHLLFAVITGSHIKKVRLFPKISSRSRTSGGAYVEFAPRNSLLGSLSCFLSGIGPMIFCPFIIMVLMYVLAPQLYHGVIDVFVQVNTIDHDNLLHTINTVLRGFFSSFHLDMLEDLRFWGFLILAIPIANECVLSGADVKNAGKGFFMLLFLLVGIGLVVSLFPAVAVPVVTGLAKAASLLMCVLCLGLMFNLIHFVMGAIVGFLL